MKQRPNFLAISLLFFGMIFIFTNCSNPPEEEEEETVIIDESEIIIEEESYAFLNHRDSVPTKEEWSGPLFELSYDYPQTFTPVTDPTWRNALNGKPISASNALSYIDALKAYIAPNVKPFFTDNSAWTSAKYGWFNGPWMGVDREAILGTYLGNANPANMFKSLKVNEAGYALVLYDSLAAYTVGQIWGATGEKPNLMNNAAQFEEGSVIVKFAFSNINYPEWPVLEGAQTFNVYDTIATHQNSASGYQVREVSFFQMDVIVKDSKTAPETGWVFSTFVYDKDAEGDFWDKMVALGAMWGDDPDVNSPLSPPYPKLAETVINPDAPFYSKETLGWGGRLSGPNDGAVAQTAYDLTTGEKYENLALSSCMSCHSPAQQKFKSFLLPGPFPTSDSLFVYTPGSDNWNLWFRNDYGDVPFDKGEIAMDYDMVMAFKSYSNYQKYKSKEKVMGVIVDNFELIRQYRTRYVNGLE